MKIKIRTEAFRFTMPVPVRMAGFVIKILPSKAFAQMQAKTPEKYRPLVTKTNLRMLVNECLGILKENKGLEIVHVEAADGTFVSIKL